MTPSLPTFHGFRDVLTFFLAVHLLFSILITIFDVFLLLGLMYLGIEKIQGRRINSPHLILAIFGYLVFLSKPDIQEGIFAGFLPPLGIGLQKEMKP